MAATTGSAPLQAKYKAEFTRNRLASSDCCAAPQARVRWLPKRSRRQVAIGQGLRSARHCLLPHPLTVVLCSFSVGRVSPQQPGSDLGTCRGQGLHRIAAFCSRKRWPRRADVPRSSRWPRPPRSALCPARGRRLAAPRAACLQPRTRRPLLVQALVVARATPAALRGAAASSMETTCSDRATASAITPSRCVPAECRLLLAACSIAALTRCPCATQVQDLVTRCRKW